MPRAHPRTALLCLTIVLLAGGGLTACRTAVAGKKCATADFAQDSRYVLQCRSGTWVRVMTKSAAASALVKLLSPKPAAGPGSDPSGSGGQPNDPSNPTPAGRTVVQTDAGSEFECRLWSDGVVECSGRDTDGQLSDGSLAGVTQIAVGGNHACALLADGTVRCWGNGFFGQLGNGAHPDQPTPAPVPVTGLAGVTSIAAGFNHTCALLDSGAVRCWGANSEGQLGDGSNTNRATPVAVGASVADAVQIATGDDHSCARLATGAVRCWGNNAFGQLGDNTTTNRTTPVAMAGVADATSVRAESYRTCVAVGDAETCVGSA